MAVHDSGLPLGQWLMDEDLPTLKFFSRHINRLGNYPGGLFMLMDHGLWSIDFAHTLLEIGTKEQLRDDLEMYFAKCCSGGAKGDDIRRYLVSARERYIMLQDKTEWLQKNESACLFFFLSMVSKLDLPEVYGSLNDARRASKHSIPKDHKSRYGMVLEMFDASGYWDNTAYISQLERDYSDAQERVKPLKWLEHDKGDSCQWAWNYLLNFHEARVEVLNKAGGEKADLGYNIATIPLLFWLEPQSKFDQGMAFYAALQTWRCSPVELAFFRTSISKAWRQRQLRRSDDLRAVNTHIRTESKEQLDALSRRFGLSLQKTLESIIEKAYLDMRRKMP